MKGNIYFIVLLLWTILLLLRSVLYAHLAKQEAELFS